MTPREELITEVWKEESRASGIRLIELEDKSQDGGLTHEEQAEYEVVLEENRQLFKKMLEGVFHDS